MASRSESSKPRACVIGAGSSGIAAAKALQDRGLDFDCFEASDRVGGNWAYGNPNGVSAAYRSLFINTSKWLMQYSDFPMPEDLPAYPHHTHIYKYFNDYVDHFGLRERIRFNTEVKRVEPEGDSLWKVRLADGSEHLYDAVMVANGHHWDQKWPDFPGEFEGTVMHAHDYREPRAFEGREVLVVGIGNSAVDIASEVSRVAETTWLSTRRGAHVVPKFVRGKPLDRVAGKTADAILSRMPLAVSRAFFRRLIEGHQGKMTDWGLPEPDHPLLSAHPTVSADFLPLVQHGRIRIKPDIKELCGDRVAFVDGSEEPIDIIVYATGYKISFPFLSEEIVDPTGNRLRLYRHVVHPDQPGLYFIGFVQPLGAVMPIAEQQSVWIAQVIAGDVAPPSREAMERSIDKDLARMAKRYVASTRHTIQVDFHPYLRQIKREVSRRRRGSSSEWLDRAQPSTATDDESSVMPQPR